MTGFDAAPARECYHVGGGQKPTRLLGSVPTARRGNDRGSQSGARRAASASRGGRQRGRQRLGGVTVALSKVQSVDQRMRLECAVDFRQAADVPSHTSGAAMCQDQTSPRTLSLTGTPPSRR